jgi:outer membrane lipoprotein-sorting protein
MKKLLKIIFVITLFSFSFCIFSINEVNAQESRKPNKIYKKEKKKKIISRKRKTQRKASLKLTAKDELLKKQKILSEILKRMDEHNKRLNALRANVQMFKRNAQLNIEDEYKGKVAYRPNGKSVAVRIDWSSPQEETLSVLNDKYVIYRPKLNQVLEGKVKRKYNSVSNFAFLNMTREELKSNYLIDYLGKKTINGIEVWHLMMTPKAKVDYKLAELWIDKDGMPIQSKVTENNNDITTALLSSLEKNVTIAGAFFAVQVPADAKKIKG